jgi:hypothetical protein
VGVPFSSGVYTLGRYSQNYPYVLDLTYPISADALYNVEIGSIVVSGDDVFVSWKMTSNGLETFGIDKLDNTTKYPNAILETRLLTGSRPQFGTFQDFTFMYSELPGSTNFTLKYSKDYGATWIDVPLTLDEDRKVLAADDLGIEATVLQLQLTATVDVNDTPSLEKGKITVN